jgi:hypothetical protein
MTTELPACRRTVLRGAALAGAAGLGLTACGGSGGGSADGPTKAVELGAATEVPVGGAKLYREDKVIVAQPQKGTYKASQPLPAVPVKVTGGKLTAGPAS